MSWMWRLWLLFSVIVASAFGGLHAADGPPVRHVVLVSVDGLAASYLNDPRAEMPTLRKLAKSGAVAQGMITSFPSVTWPAHTSLITGVQPARHGVIGNSVWSRKLDRPLTYIGDPELTKDEAIKVPTLDRKSTRLNSSHTVISYAVFCLK